MRFRKKDKEFVTVLTAVEIAGKGLIRLDSVVAVVKANAPTDLTIFTLGAGTYTTSYNDEADRDAGFAWWDKALNYGVIA